AWCGNYESAREQLHFQDFDVALVDYQIGARTGLQFISQVGPLYPECPMILLTGLRNNEIDRAAQEAGAADYLVKDSLTEELLDRSIRYARQHAKRWTLLNSVLNNAVTGMVALDETGAPFVWNKQALRALDLPEPFTGNIAQALEQQLDRIQVSASMAEEFQSNRGETFEVNINQVPGGGHIVAFHDITRRVRAEGLLRKAVDDAEAANHAKSTFLATMSHELRTPLNGILGMVQVLEKTVVDESQRGYVQTISDSGSHLLGVINDILDLSKIEAGHVTLERIPFDLPKIVDEVVQLMAPSATQKGLEIVSAVNPLVPGTVVGDPLRFKQIISNLISNAIKFTSAGSVSIAVNATEHNSEWLIYCDVVDTGIGIPEGKREQLFQKFVQADDSTTRRYGGTGLGLALCRELVGLMGGEIDCRSVDGKGSTFRFAFPAGPVDPSTFAVIHKRTALMRDKHVLVITPNAAIASATNTVMCALSATTDAVSTIDEARTAIATRPITHIIVDNLKDDASIEAVADLLHSEAAQNIKAWELMPADGNPRLPHAARYGVLPRPLTAEGLMSIAATTVPAASDVRAVDANASVASGGLKILLAEDDIPNQRVAMAVLRTSGYEADVANDGAEAVAKVDTTHYDVILMDMNMPNMDGLEATRLIRKLPNGRDVPIVGITANASSDDKAACLAAGMNQHMAKPVDWDRLMSLLNALATSDAALTA
ncbi:MAG: response regulator, partial [Pseudomonadota bacterium]